jgi:hypothetical protein
MSENTELPKTMIDRTVELLSEYTDAHELFLRAGAYYLASATLGKYVIAPNFRITCQCPNL